MFATDVEMLPTTMLATDVESVAGAPTNTPELPCIELVFFIE